MLAVGQTGYEALLAGELAGPGRPVVEQGPGWARLGGGGPPPGDAACAHLVLGAPVELRAAPVNALARQAFDYFTGSLGNERITAPWPCRWSGAGGATGLGRRTAAVAEVFHELLRRRFSRVAALAAADGPGGPGPARGLFVHFTAFDRAFAARDAVLGGQRRMADDPAAPSRSYLKVEEAYGILGAEPRAGETVADLGAAPGGWSYSAARRGARVIAVDRGPLKGGALDHPRIVHRREDAFGFRPGRGEAFDWLFCDLVEEPHHVLRNLVTPWLEQRWCRRFVVNLKFGRTDPLALLRELRADSSPFVRRAAAFRIRHLYHDREEFTVTGTAGP